MKLTHDTFVNRLLLIRPNFLNEYSFLSKYESTHKKINIFHKKCGFSEWFVTPNKLISGLKNCPKCSGGISFSNEEFKKEFEKIKDSEEYSILDIYKNCKTPLKMIHLKCKKEIFISWANFKEGYRCAFCSNSLNSKGIREIKKYLNEINLSYQVEKKFEGLIYKNYLLCDFFIPSMNLVIEFDGEQHFKEARFFKDKGDNLKKLELVKIRDQIKNKFMVENKINFLRLNCYQSNLKNILNDFMEECSTTISQESTLQVFYNYIDIDEELILQWKRGESIYPIIIKNGKMD